MLQYFILSNILKIPDSFHLKAVSFARPNIWSQIAVTNQTETVAN